jgi:excisionase family DNA binding protein
VSEVADLLGFTPRTILSWIERGDLEACRLPNGRLRISQSAVTAILEAGRTTKTAFRVVSDADGDGD